MNYILDAEQLDHLKSHSPSDELDLFFVPNSPLLSPFLASDAELKKLPPISLMACILFYFFVTFTFPKNFYINCSVKWGSIKIFQVIGNQVNQTVVSTV